jgi:hypothetical protein
MEGVEADNRTCAWKAPQCMLENPDKKKKRLQPWDNCKRLKFGGHLPHPGGRLTPFSGVNHLVSRCPTLSIARGAPPIPAARQNAKTQ